MGERDLPATAAPAMAAAATAAAAVGPLSVGSVKLPARARSRRSVGRVTSAVRAFSRAFLRTPSA